VALRSDLLADRSTDDDPASYVRRAGRVLREFGPQTQDSANVSWLLDVGPGQLFVKSAGLRGAQPSGAPEPWFHHAGRVALLRNAVALAGSCDRPALPRLLNVVESPAGPLLVYEAAAGELVHTPRATRADPASAYQRFAHLPGPVLLSAMDVLVDLHRELADVGWVAVDLYDGCLLFDFGTGRLRVVDLGTYRRGPSINDMGRMFGADRFMAPEEHVLGAVLDQRTTVLTLGRLAWHFGTRLTEKADNFCGPRALASVLRRACAPAPTDRFGSVAAFAHEFHRVAITTAGPGER
jgi:serine/threonine-protein kinase